MCFPFPSFVFSVHNLSERQICGTVANLKKNLFVYFPFCWSFFHIYLSLHVFFFFEISFFLFYSHVFLNILLFKFSFLIVFSSVTPFLCISFSWRLCLVWSSFFFSFFSPFTYSPFFHKTPCFLNCFRSHGLFFFF